MRRLAIASLSFCLVLLAAYALAAERPKYDVRYHVTFEPQHERAAVRIETTRGSGRLVSLDLDMPAATYSAIEGDGSVTRSGERVHWVIPQAGGTLRYRVALEHRRGDGYDSMITPDWVITRGDRLVPPARVRATKDSGSTAKLEFALPSGWDDVETPFSKVTGGRFAVTNPEHGFDRPIGWIAAGDLSSVREAVAGTRVTLTSPRGERVDHVATLAILRQALPAMLDAFGKAPEKLLIVRSGDPMWRGGLSAPASLWLHAERPLLSANGTSTLLHELTHVITDVRGAGRDDWIAEGLAEFYSLEIGRRAGLISQARFDKSLRLAARDGDKVDTLRATASARDRTRKAVALFAALDRELRAAGSDIDALTARLMRRDKVSLAELRSDAAALEQRESKVLATIE